MSSTLSTFTVYVYVGDVVHCGRVYATVKGLLLGLWIMPYVRHTVMF